jgi:hypothetical protein
MKNYRLIYNNEKEVIDIIEATGTTCSNGNNIIEGSISDIYQIISELNLTNNIPLSSFNI